MILNAMLTTLGLLSLSAAPAHANVLDLILDDAGSYQGNPAGIKAAVLMDLDDTLIDSKPRMLQIFHELAEEPTVQTRFREESKILGALTLSDIYFNSDDTLMHVGIQNKVLLEYAREYYKERYFTSDYLVYDKAYEGAVEYVQELIKQEAQIFYITGRNEPAMGKGTRKSLRDLGFPTDENTTLILKPNPKLDDAEYKKSVFKEILKSEYQVIAGFENEPRNLNYMGEAFPKATMVFIDSFHSSKPDEPLKRAYWIKNWKWDQANPSMVFLEPKPALH